MPEKKKKDGVAKIDMAAHIHQLVGRVHRLKILLGRDAKPATIDRYQRECDAKESELNKLSKDHEGLVNKELAMLGYVPK